MTIENTIGQAYEAFNNRNIEAVLALMAPDVYWPNGWEGGYLQGHSAVGSYWIRQWKELNPVVIPVAIKELEKDHVEVTVRQVVKDNLGDLLSDSIVKHVYQFENGLIKSMKIEK